MKKVYDIDTDSRIFVVGDLHGEHQMLVDEMEKVNFDKEKDHIFSVGDLTGRGDQNLECLCLIEEPWFHAVRGNHEDMMIRAVMEGDESYAQCWFGNGGNWYWSLDAEGKLIADSAINRAYELPYWMEINHKGHKIVVCHADWPDDKYHDNPDLHQMIWSRDRINKLIEFREHSPIEGADLFVFGHTPLKDKLHVDNCMWIDTGAVFGKKLTMIEL